MASFVLTGTSTTAKTLASTETGFIGVNGALVVDTADAISGTGVNSLTILGALVNQSFFFSRAAYDFTGSSATVLVGATGNISSHSHSIFGRPTAQMLVTNDGVIAADEMALNIVAGDSSAAIQVINNGAISSQNVGMSLFSGAQSTNIINTGTISGITDGIRTGSFFGTETGRATLVNSGTVIGLINAYVGRDGVDEITNSGFISGGIKLAGGDDTYDGALGSVSGTVMGEAGNDTLIGGIGSDDLHGGDDNDIIKGGDGDDLLDGGDGSDIINTGKGDDVASGGVGNDRIWGRDGADTLTGGAGNDLLRGGAGDDQINGDGGNDDIRGGAGDDIINGGAGRDTILGKTGNDTISGGASHDELRGQTGDDNLSGKGGNDDLRGGGGDDTLNGGAGNDTMNGGSGNDTFIFATGDGDDTVEDFNATGDGEKIDLSAVASIGTITQLNAAASQVGADVIIDTGGGNSILLLGVALGDMGNGDFIF